ncbi:hypothetical protein HC031_03235 [Planosporangium thailandense]|uniref:Uncharacterized protein n=1 Tax=Planosporangium thailandense TaxID=765197 RepID=A0ABX0XRV5_9ACTN|nr:hypothetical protein [Planosporangium thailandense]NJC68744.1 hypothetical protein [Planosporangium thailandense]
MANARTEEIVMLVKWMDTLAPKTLRPYIYTGRHRAPRLARPAQIYAGPGDLLVR